MAAPVFWMHETTGKMKRIVHKFLNNTPLSAEELGVMRWYVHQFVDALPSKPDDYKNILNMSQQELNTYCFNVLLDMGIDPF